MSVLLRQPHGFEGFGSLLVEPMFNDASVAKGPNQNALRFDLDSVPAPRRARFGTTTCSPALDEFVRRDGDPIERLEEGVPKASDSLVSAVDACLETSGPRPIRPRPRGRTAQEGRPYPRRRTPRGRLRTISTFCSEIRPHPALKWLFHGSRVTTPSSWSLLRHRRPGRVATRRSSRRSRPTLRGSP